MRHLQSTLNKIPGERLELDECYRSLTNFHDTGLLEDKEKVFTADITEQYTINDALRDARKKLKNQIYPSVLAIEYKESHDGTEQVGHCVAMMPNGNYIDVNEKQYWRPTLDCPISKIHVVKVEESSVVKWQRNCGLHKCMPT